MKPKDTTTPSPLPPSPDPGSFGGIQGVIVQVTNPESPFGGVQVFGPDPEMIQVVFTPGGQTGGGSGPGGGPSVPTTTDLLAGDGLGGVTDSGIAPANVVVKQASYPTPTTNNQVIQCLRAAGLCA